MKIAKKYDCKTYLFAVEIAQRFDVRKKYILVPKV